MIHKFKCTCCTTCKSFYDTLKKENEELKRQLNKRADVRFNTLKMHRVRGIHSDALFEDSADALLGIENVEEVVNKAISKGSNVEIKSTPLKKESIFDSIREIPFEECELIKIPCRVCGKENCFDHMPASPTRMLMTKENARDVAKFMDIQIIDATSDKDEK